MLNETLGKNTNYSLVESRNLNCRHLTKSEIYFSFLPIFLIFFLPLICNNMNYCQQSYQILISLDNQNNFSEAILQHTFMTIYSVNTWPPSVKVWHYDKRPLYYLMLWHEQVHFETSGLSFDLSTV